MEEHDFLADYDPSQFDRPSVTVDVTLLAVQGEQLVTWLVRRKEHPYRGRWALPGGFVGIDESLDDAAARVLSAKSGVSDVYLEQLFTFGAPNRDPRMRVISVSYYALVDLQRLLARDHDRAGVCVGRLEVPWEGQTGGAVEVRREDSSLRLAFDHAAQIGMAVARVRGHLANTPIGFQLLPSRFTIRALQDVHEAVLGHTLNKDSFRRRMLASGELQATGEYQTDVGHRPAELYRFASRRAI